MSQVHVMGLEAYVFIAFANAFGLWVTATDPPPPGTPWWVFVLLGCVFALGVYAVDQVHCWIWRILSCRSERKGDAR